MRQDCPGEAGNGRLVDVDHTLMEASEGLGIPQLDVSTGLLLGAE